MSKETLSLFHEHLLLFLQDDLHQKKREGWDERLDSEVRSYRDLLSQAMRGHAPLRLQEIVEKYKHLFEERGPVHLEHKILEAFPDQEMKRLGLPPLRMYRGLPRLFCKTAPALQSRIHPAFSHLPSLKYAALAKALYSMYAHVPVPKDAKAAILARVGAASFGEEIHHLFKQAFPFLEIRTVLFGGAQTPEDLRYLRNFDLLLQIGSEDSEISEAVKQIILIDDPRPQPIVESISRSSSCGEIRPLRPSVHSMGLHFLDRGIFLPSFRTTTLADLENPALLKWVFGAIGACPGPQEIEEVRKRRRFFLSRLSSQDGVFVYLHALLKSLEWDNKEIDICIPDPIPFVEYFRSRLALEKPLLENNYKVGKIVVSLGAQTASIDISPEGKTVRLLSPDRLSGADLNRLLLLSEDFTGISDDAGFSGAVSANKGFFFDPSSANRSFVKDLIALAENRIAAHRSTLSILRLFTKVYEHQLRMDGAQWVDENSIQCEEKESLLEIAEKIGLYLQDPDALAGFKKLNHLIAKEHSCNGFFLQMLQRAVSHRRHPEVACSEEEAVSKFTQSQISLAHLSEHLRDSFLS